ncbi:MAG: B12-binding domain-containing radical SAM protein [Candidatus Omnitrophica bacterium]|nr:B12-binding domain-containing radical SAM protein [Candidatus Omnitrophota bacterium]
MKIVVANSIGVDRQGNYIIHSPSRWSEGVRCRAHWFAYYPWELAYLSSLLKRQTAHAVRFVDGCLWRLNGQRYEDLIVREKPELLIVESATRMIEENAAMALRVKVRSGAKLVFVGQHASAFPDELLSRGIDYVCCGEYEMTVLALCRGEPPETIAGLYPQPRRPLLDVRTLPWPEDDDVRRMDYGIPGEPSSEFREIQMYASRGCPMSCSFCVARNVYYAQANWRPRAIADVIAEITALKRKYPAMEGVFFDEEAHNGSREFIVSLTAAIRAAGLAGLRYEAMCDLRLLDEELLAAMHAAGYYKIRVGIESVSREVLAGMGKGLEPAAVEQRLAAAKRVGLKTYGTFMLGAPASTERDDEKTVAFMRRLFRQGILDNAQISICTPQPGTPFYEQACRQGWLNRQVPYHAFDGGCRAIVDYPGYRARRISRMRRRAFLMRDHAYLARKLVSGGWLSWILEIYRRYGARGLLRKAAARLRAEVAFCVENLRVW